jgi:hypothetical protein
MAQAFAALGASSGARVLYEAERASGTEHNPALRKLASRLVGILHGCLKTRTLNLDWNDDGRFDWFASDAVYDVSTLAELIFDRNTLGQYLIDSGLRKSGADQCTLLALGAFDLVQGLGQTSGRNIAEGGAGSPCATSPGRNDNCCVTVDTTTGSGVIYHYQ